MLKGYPNHADSLLWGSWMAAMFQTSFVVFELWILNFELFLLGLPKKYCHCYKRQLQYKVSNLKSEMLWTSMATIVLSKIAGVVFPKMKCC